MLPYLLAAIALVIATSDYAAPDNHPASIGLSAKALLGKRLFYETALSGSGRMSCASCHDPRNHYAPSNDRAVQLGGTDMKHAGYRAVPSLTYLDQAPAFNINQANPDGSASGPAGGFDWDGREDSIAAQSAAAMVTTYEMAGNPALIVRKLENSASYREPFRQIFGSDIFDSPNALIKAIGAALEAYQREDPSFHPYTSKYDYYVRGLATFSASELRGMAVFNDADGANCAACHTAGIAPGRNGTYANAQFTDYFYRNIGVPRNTSVDYSAIGGYDLGLCGPFRRSLPSGADKADCGMFATPSLRNAASRHVFFHNGSLHSLKDVIAFYITRDITPTRWYGAHSTEESNDLPAQYQQSIDRTDLPFATEGPRHTPALSPAQTADLAAFLETLDDGYNPGNRDQSRH